MRTFLEHHGALSVTQFPHAAQSRSGERWLAQVVDAINSARTNGAIPNPVYTNVKDLANRIIEDTLLAT